MFNWKGNRIVFALLMIGLFLLSGCEPASVLKEYVCFRHAQVTLPETMVKIENGIIDEVSYKRSGHPLLVRYYAPEECSDCALNHMNDNFKYHSMSQREGLFDFIVVMAPPEKDRTRVIEKAMAMNNPLAIYIDSSYYLKNKGVIPSFPGFHLFLLDADGTPVFVGNPLQNESTKSRFNRRLGYLIY